ncbi:MAG: putative holin [Pusillimonas sp.]
MEPTSSAASATILSGAVVATSLMPGVDAEALIGAFAGAVVFALHANDTRLAKRLAYMVVSFVIGYMAAPEVAYWTGLKYPVVAAFAASATIVTLALASIDKIKQFDITSIWKKG